MQFEVIGVFTTDAPEFFSKIPFYSKAANIHYFLH